MQLAVCIGLVDCRRGSGKWPDFSADRALAWQLPDGSKPDQARKVTD
jgi:hypothetical protein